MTREETKAIMPILQAYAEGKVIQYSRNGGYTWHDVAEDVNHNIRTDKYDYRIKPTPTYRPFANAEECWNEMLKHQPVGWVKHDGIRECITCVRNGDGDCISFSGVDFDLEYLFKNVTFEDDSVFGIKEEK